MYITDLYIRGYGIFQDCRVQELSPGLNVFLGDNEAGKSTCLAFIRDVFFGAPDGRSKEKSYPVLHGGRWGGSLGLSSSQWQHLLLHREPGRRGGKLSITSPEGQQMGPEVLNRLLGGTTREVFRNIYAFSLSELQTLETLSTERIKDAIYSAGLGAGLSSLPQVQKELENRREKLFKPGGQKQSINQLISSTEAIRKDLRQAQGDIQAFDRVTQELESLEQQRQEVKQHISSQQGRLSWLQSLHSRWEEWSEYQGLRQELRELPQVESFPDNGLQRYQSLAHRLQGLQEQLSGGEAEEQR
ncbi:MAG: AAA family ATPase, partial [Desulfohalobiaceae bacterium]